MGKRCRVELLASKRISELIVNKLFGTLHQKKILILGFAFKANTNDTRESSAIQICKDLLQEGAKLYIHDPKVSSEQISEDLNAKLYSYESEMENSEKPLWFKVEDISKDLENADAVLILTEWDEYGKINWNSAAEMMRSPAWVFDADQLLISKKSNQLI